MSTMAVVYCEASDSLGSSSGALSRPVPPLASVASASCSRSLVLVPVALTGRWASVSNGMRMFTSPLAGSMYDFLAWSGSSAAFRPLTTPFLPSPDIEPE